MAFDEASVQFPREKWENLEDWQKELYKNALKGSYEPSISVGKEQLSLLRLGFVVASPGISSGSWVLSTPSAFSPKGSARAAVPQDTSGCSRALRPLVPSSEMFGWGLSLHRYNHLTVPWSDGVAAPSVLKAVSRLLFVL